MVKLKGPLGSAEARGSFGDSAVFSSWKGRSYARSKTIPTNPKTPMQVSTRAMMAFLANQWSTLTEVQKATWNAAASNAKIPAYNQFISANLGRWSELRAPGRKDPATEAGNLPSVDTFYAEGKTAHAELAADWYDLNNAWGLLIFRSTASGFAPSRSNCIAIIPLTATGGPLYDDQGLEPRPYHYNFRSFTTDGKLSANLGQVSAIVT